jgi:hypothetical protein
MGTFFFAFVIIRLFEGFIGTIDNIQGRIATHRYNNRTDDEILLTHARSYNYLLNDQPEYEWQWSKHFTDEEIALANQIR